MSSPPATRSLAAPDKVRSDARIRRGRRAVLLVALPVLAFKLFLALRTGGTGDVKTWGIFADGVRQKGPIGVYSIDFQTTKHRLYNHPPLIGWLLVFINALSSVGIPLRFSLRAISSLADIGSALLAFEILRRRQALSRAITVGMVVAASPVLVLISGYHGNTDPIFVALVLLAAFLLVDQEMAVLAGAALALAISVKIVPVVTLPALFVYLVRYRRPLLLRAVPAFVVVFLVVWAGPLLTHWSAIKNNVLGYAGIATRQWGLVEIFRRTDQAHVVQFLDGPGTNLATLIASLVPAAIVWWRRDYAVQGVCLSLVLFLALSPAFGVQYLAWTLAAACILDLWFGVLLNVVAGIFLFLVYYHWNRGFPWTRFAGGNFTTIEANVGLAAWFVLLALGVYHIVFAAWRPRPAALVAAAPEIGSRRAAHRQADSHPEPVRSGRPPLGPQGQDAKKSPATHGGR